MNIEEFKTKYASYKDIDKIEITCDHPDHKPVNEILVIGKQPVKRNILKNDGKQFICRKCCLTYNNPMHREQTGNRQSDEVIIVLCPHPDHEGEPSREMKKSCFYGALNEPYFQICKSCSQLGREVSEDTKEAIRMALKDIPKSEEFKQKLRDYMKNNPEGIAIGKANLVPGIGGGWNKGINTPEDVKQKMSETMTGREYTEKHCENISIGRKKMLEETGGFSKEHREKLSAATIRQYANGFEPKLHHLSGWHNSPKAGRVFHRSSYEKKAFMKLDEDDTVETYFVEKISIQYTNPEKEIDASYLIDIEVKYKDGSNKLLEIKPAKWLEDSVIKAKLEAGHKYAESINVPFEVWTEFILFGAVYNEKNMRGFVEKLRKELKT